MSGAGISTNAGIPDFRGPNGIWTAEQGLKKKQRISNRSSKKKGRKVNSDGKNDRELPSSSTSSRDIVKNKKRPIDKISCGGNKVESKQFSFETATPTITHKSITRLVELDIVKYVITQNVDGLHRRSGLPREKHAVLHGCIFTEQCEKCHKEYFRDFDVGGVSFQKTGRKCEEDGCDGDLRDTILDWEDELPDKDWILSQEHCGQSDLGESSKSCCIKYKCSLSVLNVFSFFFKPF